MSKEPFYVVWCPGGGNPTVRHDYHTDALGEAERLSRQNPGKEFFVLMATDRLTKNDVQHDRLADPAEPAIPF